MSDKCYRMGKHFKRCVTGAYAITALLFFVFYFVYLYVYKLIYPQLSSDLLLLIFLVAGALMLWLEYWCATKVRSAVYYTVTDSALVIHGFKNETVYPWKDFSSAYLDRFSFNDLCKIRFVCGGRTLKLPRYISDPCGLACDIIRRIEAYTDVDEEIKKQMSALAGVEM